MDNREKMRRLIDMIEKGANNPFLTQAIDDIKLLSNTTSLLVNELDTRLRNKDAVKKRAAPTVLEIWTCRAFVPPQVLV